MGTKRIKVWIATSKIGSECTDHFEIDAEEWNAMAEEDREEACRDAAFNYLDWGWEEVK